MKKCPYCAEEIQDEAIVCKHCNRNLLPVTTRSSYQQTPIKKKKSNWLIFVIIIIIVSLLCMCGVVVNILSDTSKELLNSTPSQLFNPEKPTLAKTITPAPTSTPIFWDSTRVYPQPVPGLYQTLVDNKKAMTDIQFADYLSSIKGQRVHLKASVVEVSENNTVQLSPTEGSIWNAVILSGLPREILITLNKNQIIEFDATFKDFSVFIIYQIEMDDPIIYTIR